MTKVTYIDHSGFLLETDSCSLLFDYYQGTVPQLDPSRELIVFSSHFHQDHYSKKIWRLAEQYPRTKYVLSKDIRRRSGSKEALYVSKNAEYEIELQTGETLRLTTLRSTDEGVAFLIELSGKLYYHAGDLNLWIWEGDSDVNNANMERAYRRELEKLRGMKIDIAFIPIDPRLEQNAYMGMASYLETTDTAVVFPMHFWGKYQITEDFLAQEEYRKYRNVVKKLHYPGEAFLLD